MRTRFSIFLLAPVVFARPLWAADNAPAVRAEISPSTAKLGDVLKLQVEVRYPNGFSVQPPNFQSGLGTFEVRASTALAAQVEGAQTVARFEAQLQNFTTGQQTLPGLEVPFQDIQGGTHTIKTPPVPVTIEAVPPGPKDKEGEIRGIKGVVGPVAASMIWGVLIAVLLIAAGAFAWTRRRRAIAGPPPPPPVPADEEALEALLKLHATGWLESGKLKEFYSGLSDIVRTYLERGFSVPALERTTNELVRDLRKRALWPSESLLALQSLLESCDLVKFAKFRPDPAQGAQDHAAAARIVEQTKGLLAAP